MERVGEYPIVLPLQYAQHELVSESVSDAGAHGRSSGVREMVDMEKEARKDIRDCGRNATPTTPVFMAISETLSILIFVGGIAVLAGWALDIPVLKSVFPGLVTMKVNTALGFIFSGLSLWLLQIKRCDNPRYRVGALISSLVVCGIGLATFLEYVLGWDPGIDQLLFKELPGAVFTSSLGRMALNTAINFTVIGLALFLLACKSKDLCFFFQVLMIPVAGVTLLSLIGYLYKAAPLFIGVHFGTAMALHTSVLFMMVSLAGLFCRPGCGFMTALSSEGSGGKIMRRLLLLTLLFPPAVGWMKIHFEKIGVMSNELGVSFVATMNLLFFSVYVFILSIWLNRAESKKTEMGAALVRSELSYRRLFEAAKDGILIVDFETGVITDVNPYLVDLLSYSKEEFLDKQLWEIGFLKNVVASKEAFDELRAHNYIRYEDQPLETKSGDKVSVEFISNVYLAGSKKVIQCNVRNITERKRAENALRESEKRFMDVLYASRDAILLIDADTFVDCNESTALLLGYANRSDFLMKHPSELSPPVQPDGRRSLEKANEMMGVALKRGFHRFEWIHRKASGEDFPVEVSLTPIVVRGKNVLHCLWRDLTEKKKTELEVVKSRDYLNNIINSVADPIFVKDSKHQWVLFNSAFCGFMGRQREELDGKSDYDFFPKAEADAFWTKDQIVLEAGDPDMSEEFFTDAKGATHIIVTKKTLYTDPSGEKMIVGVIRDVTSFKRAEEALKKQQERLEELVRERTLELELSNKKLMMTAGELRQVSSAKSEFLATMSHELRTPLCSVIGFSEVIHDERYGPLNERQKKYITNVLTSGRHLLSLINDVLDLSRIEAGKMILDKTCFSLKGCSEEIARLVEGLAFSKRIKLVQEVPEDLGEICADQRKIKQVIFNLLSNAIKFTPADGRVGLRGRREDAGFEIAVWDTGTGVEPGNLEKAFEAFERIEDPSGEYVEGAGLGLTISRKIVQLHGGKIWAESEGLGRGTTVKFTLPLKGD